METLVVNKPEDVEALLYRTGSGEMIVIRQKDGSARAIPVLGDFKLASFTEEMPADLLQWFYEGAVKSTALQIAKRFLEPWS